MNEPHTPPATRHRVLGGAIKNEMLANGGRLVWGTFQYGRRTNRCFLQ